MIGLQPKLFRTKDGREMGWGIDAVEGMEEQNVKDISQSVGRVFAVHFGCLPH